jgi:hypothetical protein
VAIKAAIKGLCIEAFTAHLAWEKPRTIEKLYSEFEKYYRSDNDLHRKLEEHNQIGNSTNGAARMRKGAT